MDALIHTDLLDRLLGVMFLIGFGALLLATFRKHGREIRADFHAWRDKRKLKKLLEPSKKGLHK